jgi:hypothetical protein
VILDQVTNGVAVRMAPVSSSGGAAIETEETEPEDQRVAKEVVA